MRRFSLFIIMLLLAGADLAGAGESEHKVKAAMIYNFAKFVEWPPETLPGTDKLLICVTGKNSLGQELQQLQGKPVKGRAVAVRMITKPEEAAGCQILFLAGSERDRLTAYQQQAGRHGVLTVSDMEAFAAAGGMIGFYEEDGKVRFEVNPAAAQKARLQVSSHLLRLARIVR